MAKPDFTDFIAATLPPPQQWKGQMIWRPDLGVHQVSDGLAWWVVGAAPGSGVAAATVIATGRRSSNGPYRLATYGHSKMNVSTQELATTSTGYGCEKPPTQLLMLRGDMRLVFNGGVSGDVTSNYDSATRIANSQGIAALIAAQPDLVYYQYFINDNIAGTAAATTIAKAKEAISEMMGAGIFVAVQAEDVAAPGPVSFINGAAVAGGYSATTNPAEYNARLALTLTCNAAIRDWIAQFPGRAVYVDTSDLTTGADGFAKTDKTYADGTHVTAPTAYAIAQRVNAAILPYFPRQPGLIALTSSYRNALNGAWVNVAGGLAAGVSLAGAEAGSVTMAGSVGIDEDGDLVQIVTITPTALAGGTWRGRVDLQPAFVGGAAIVPVAAGDVMQSSVIATIDDGAGGAPLGAYNVYTRARIFYNDASNEYVTCGETQFGSSTDHPPLTAKRTYRFVAPRRAIKAAMPSANITANTALQVLVTGNALLPVRLALKAPVWRKVA